MLAFAGSTHCEGTPMWLSDALFTSLYASLAPAEEGALVLKHNRAAKSVRTRQSTPGRLAHKH